MFISNNNGNTPWNLTRASIDALVKAIEAGGDEVFSAYLQTMARFHHYSARNAILIAAQFPHASCVKGVRSWNELGRFVRPGEKGICIFAPAVGVANQRKGNAPDAGVKKTSKGKKTAEPAAQPVSPEPQLLEGSDVAGSSQDCAAPPGLRFHFSTISHSSTAFHCDSMKKSARGSSITLRLL